MSWSLNSIYETVKRKLAEPTAFEKRVADSHKDFEARSVIARGDDVLKVLAKYAEHGFIEPLYRDGRVYANPFTPINNYIFVGKVAQDAVFMKPDPLLLYKVPYSQFDRVISVDAYQNGVLRAAWQVPIIHAIVGFSIAALGGFLGMGVVVTVGSGAAQVTALAQYFARNEEKIATAAKSLKSVFSDLLFIQTNCTSAYKLLIGVLMSGQSKDFNKTQFIGEFVSDNATAWGATIGKMLAGNGPGAAIEAAKKETIAITLAALISFRTVLVEFIKNKGVWGLTKGAVNGVSTIHKTYSTATKFVTGKDKETLTEADIQQILTSGCIQKPEITQRIERMAKNVGNAIVILEEMKKQLSASAL